MLVDLAFPARAGINRHENVRAVRRIGVPRTRGDQPLIDELRLAL